jgi:hypothetical protein
VTALDGEPAIPATEQGDVLRAKSRELFASQRRGGTAVDLLGFGDQLVAEIPTAMGSQGTLLAIIHRHTSRGKLCVLQVFRPGPDRARIPISGAILLQGDILALFGEAVAKLLDLERLDRPARPEPYRPQLRPRRPGPGREASAPAQPRASHLDDDPLPQWAQNEAPQSTDATATTRSPDATGVTPASTAKTPTTPAEESPFGFEGDDGASGFGELGDPAVGGRLTEVDSDGR